MKILVVGCLGFIGSHFVKSLAKMSTSFNKKLEIIGFNRYSHRTDLVRLDGLYNNVEHLNDRCPFSFHLVYGDLTRDVSGLLEGIDIVVNFAAKTFVDHSIKDPEPFIQSNVVGLYRLLEQARLYKSTLKHFIQISTDEVYGAIAEGSYNERSRLNPSNPYAATKACGDMLALSYFNTYEIPITIIRTENNYGSYQHPQKVMPNFVKHALQDKPLPVYGDGKHIRMWLHVLDHCKAIKAILDNPNQTIGEIFHVAGSQELQNLDLAKMILKILGKPDDMIEFISDHDVRPGHDKRYALDSDKIRDKLHWEPEYTLDRGIEETVNWYRDNKWWLGL